MTLSNDATERALVYSLHGSFCGEQARTSGNPTRELPRTSSSETVRKASDASMAWPYSPPRRHFWAHFALRIPPKSTLGVVLIPLFGQFLQAVGWIRAREGPEPIRPRPGRPRYTPRYRCPPPPPPRSMKALVAFYEGVAMVRCEPLALDRQRRRSWRRRSFPCG
jgi:hypothetical protein